jgi:4-amino-4-deoxy-L-arabinose transferase-like glycosyltransferase
LLMGQRAQVLILLILCGVLFFFGLGSVGLTDRDEGSNAEAAREMVQSGDWLSPTLNGAPRFAKPAFLYWLISGGYRLFGVSEYAARLPSAVFGTALILLQYYFARRVLGPSIAVRAALMLLLNFEIFAIGRMVLTDMVLVFFTTLSIMSFFLAMWGKGPAKRWYWVFYAAMACATLTKGPVGALIPLLAILPYLFLARPWRTAYQVLKESRPLAGALVFLAIAAPWYTAMFLLHGEAYAASARGETITRFLTVIGGHGGTIFFYLPVLFLGFFPWSGFLPAALLHGFQNIKKRQAGDQASELAVLCTIWVITVLLFFTVSSTRLPHYIAPLFPGAALLVAGLWDRLLETRTGPAAKFSLWVTLGIGGIMALAFIGLDWAYEHFNSQIALEFPMATQIDPGWAPTLIGFLILAGMGLFGYVAMEGRAAWGFRIASALMIIIIGLVMTTVLPWLHRYLIAPPQELAAIAGLNLGPEDVLVSYGGPRPSLLFYARRDCSTGKRCIEMIKPGEERKFQQFSRHPGQIMILTQERLRPQLPAPASTYPLILNRYGYVLLAKEPAF